MTTPPVKPRMLEGKVAVVTGASQGIGLALARAFAREGASIVMSARRGDVVEEVARTLQNVEGVPVVAVQADVANRDDAQRTIAAAQEHFGRLDLPTQRQRSKALSSRLGQTLWQGKLDGI